MVNKISSGLVGIGLQRQEKEIEKQKLSWISFFCFYVILFLSFCLAAAP